MLRRHNKQFILKQAGNILSHIIHIFNLSFFILATASTHYTKESASEVSASCFLSLIFMFKSKKSIRKHPKLPDTFALKPNRKKNIYLRHKCAQT